MFEALRDFLKSVDRVINMDDIESEMDRNIQESRAVADFYTDVQNKVGTTDFKSSTLKTIYSNFYSNINHSGLDVKLTYREDFIADIAVLMNNASTNAGIINKAFHDLKVNSINTSVISANRANLLMSIPHYFFMISYAVRLLNYIISVGLAELTKRSDMADRNEMKWLQDNIATFSTLIGVYGCSEKNFQGKILALSVTEVSADENQRLEEYHREGNPLLVGGLGSNFKGSPFLFLGTLYNTWFDARYKIAQDQRTLTELKLNYLIYLKAQGNESPETERDIAHAQGKVNQLNAKIMKMEATIK